MAAREPAGGSEDPELIGLEHVDATMAAAVGGKAANLGELLAAGLPVPDGFVVTTAAYRRVAAAAGLDPLMAELAALPEGDAAAAADFAARVRAQLLAAAEPEDLAGEVRRAYAQLGPDAPVAVRSSATAEDLEFASFAGQQDTFLNVVGAEAVLAALRRCWASLWTDRALVYRLAHGVDNATVSTAVVVQRMVDAAAAGVLFTANPVTGSRRETVIEASPGLGEAVVSGAVNPDRFVVRTRTSAVQARQRGGRGVVVRSVPGGGTERRDRTPDDGAACLTDGQVKELARLGARAEVRFGAPQDAEWAIDAAGTLWLTQSRPITTLYPVPEARGGGYGPRVYLCFSLAQGLTRPLTPMGLAGIRLVASSVAANAGFAVHDPLAGPAPYTEAGQRIFIDITAAVRSRAGRAVLPRVFDVMEARSAAVLRRLFQDPEFSLVTGSVRPLLRRVGRVAWRARVPAVVLEALVRPEAALRRAERLAQPLAAFVAAPPGLGPAQRLEHVERVLLRVFPILPAVMPGAAVGFALLGLADKLLAGIARPGELQTVLRGLPHNVTTTMNLELWQLAARLRADPASAEVFRGQPVQDVALSFASGALPAQAQDGLADFLARYGHRAVAEIDLGVPRWSDDPAHLIGVLANYLRLGGDGPAPDAQFAQGAAEAERMVDRLAARAAACGRLRGWLVGWCLHRARQLMGLRELPKNYLVQVLGAVRQQLSLVGETLAAQGAIAAAEDVFFLDLTEAGRGLDGENLTALVAGRRLSYQREVQRRHVPRLLLSDGTEPEALAGGRQAPGPGVLAGSPASAGTVTARARVILDPAAARLEPGEVLVAPSTDPGWTPLFLTAGALVMEMGGANSHGAVVAREYGIPAVVGVPDATVVIRTGDVVTVDGAAGTVTLAGRRDGPVSPGG